jgi:hypothetical protein
VLAKRFEPYRARVTCTTEMKIPLKSSNVRVVARFSCKLDTFLAFLPLLLRCCVCCLYSLAILVIMAKSNKSSSTKKVATKQIVAKKIKEKPSRRVVVKRAPFQAWKGISFVGESLSKDMNSYKTAIAGVIDRANGKAYEFDFGHAPEKIRQHLDLHPGHKAFVYLGTLEQKQTVFGTTMVPHLVVILVPEGYTPPCYVAMEQADAESGLAKTDVIPLSELDLEWADPTDMNAWSTTGRVQILKSNFRRTATSLKYHSEEDMENRKKAVLWTMTPSKDWVTKPNGELEITEAAFAYTLRDGQVVHENYNKEVMSLSSFVEDFLERFDIEEKDDDYDDHYDAVKKAVKDAFQTARAEKQRLKDLLLETYDRETLEAIRVLKIYPQNDFIVDSMKGPYVGQYYGHAVNREDFPAPVATSSLFH